MPRAVTRCATQEVCQSFCIFHTLLPKITRIVGNLNKITNIIAKELQVLQQVVLCNHLALVIIIVPQKGTCAVNGSKCCTYVPQNFSIVYTITKNI